MKNNEELVNQLLVSAHDKIDDQTKELGEIKNILDRNTASLELHMKRTDLLEVRVDQVNEQVLSIKKPFDWINGLWKVLLAVGAITVTVLEIRSYLGK